MKKIIILIILATHIYFVNAQSPDWIWAKSAGGTDGEFSNSVCTDSSGNIYVTGYFGSSSINFGSYNLTNAGAGDIFLVKYNFSGDVLWAKRAGGTNKDVGNNVYTDGNGNVYVIGYFESNTITFDTITLTNSGFKDFFLVKYSPSGNALWAKRACGSFNDDIGNSVCIDTIGNVYITGSFENGYLIFDDDTIFNTYLSDIFLVKYNSSGNVIWAKSAGGDAWDYGKSICTDRSGNVYVTGFFNSPSIIFGIDTITSTGAYDAVFLLKYDSLGNALWAKKAGGLSNDHSNNITSDGKGNLYVTGQFSSNSITFDNYNLTNEDDFNIFLVKYDTSGNVLWANKVRGNYCNSVTTDINGNVYLTGEFCNSSITFGSFTLVNANVGRSDIFFVKYDSLGNVLWAKKAGGTSDDLVQSICTDNNGNVIVTGSFYSSTITFGNNTLTNAMGGINDIFVSKLNTSVDINKIVKENLGIILFPNPANYKFTIFNPEYIGKKAEFITSEGKIVKTCIIKNNTIDLST